MPSAKMAAQAASRWYGANVCVVEGDCGKAVDLHHLDPKAPESIYNLIPLSSSIHQNFHRDPVNLQPYIDSAEINSKAWRHYDSGRCKLSYGAQRFLGFVYLSRHPSQSLRHVAYALTSLRAIFSVDFAVDTIVRSALPAIPKASALSRAIFAMEMALWFRDCGDTEVGERFVCLARNLFEKARVEKSSIDSERFEMIEVVSTVLRLEQGALQRLGRLKGEPAYGTIEGNARLWEAVWYLWSNNPSTFVNLIMEAVDDVIPNVETVSALPMGVRLPKMHYWTLGQHLLLMADASNHRGKTDERFHFAHLAHQLFTITGIVPAGNLPRSSLDWYMRKTKLPAKYRIPIRTQADLNPLRPLLEPMLASLNSSPPT